MSKVTEQLDRIETSLLEVKVKDRAVDVLNADKLDFISEEINNLRNEITDLINAFTSDEEDCEALDEIGEYIVYLESENEKLHRKNKKLKKRLREYAIAEDEE